LPCHAIEICSVRINGREGYGTTVLCSQCWLDNDLDDDFAPTISNDIPEAQLLDEHEPLNSIEKNESHAESTDKKV
jgi:hypothetical protein